MCSAGSPLSFARTDRVSEQSGWLVSFILPTPIQAGQTVLQLYPLADIRPAPRQFRHVVVVMICRSFTHPRRHSRIDLHHPAVRFLLVLAVVVG